MKSFKSLASLALTLCLGACALTPAGEGRRDALTRRIADDAAAYNEAYAQAISGQLLLNILRGRDRLPRHYLSMTGINDSPSLSLTENYAIGGIPLGVGQALRGAGGVGLERETQSRPSYAIQPFSTRTAFEPTETSVFSHYWAGGWPRDILLYVLVERLTVAGPDGGDYVNEANNIFRDCADDVETSGCNFVRAARAMMRDVDAAAPVAQDAQGRAICGLIEARGAARVRAIDPAEHETCPPRIAIGARVYTLHLRSLDEAVYYVGELMRAATPGETAGVVEAQLKVRAAGMRGGGRGVPLFRIVPDGAAHAPLYAASVLYAGERFTAGPAIGRSCAEATEEGVCRDDAEHGDRSSSVLSLLAELMALNQSPDALQAPSRLFVE